MIDLDFIKSIFTFHNVAQAYMIATALLISVPLTGCVVDRRQRKFDKFDKWMTMTLSLLFVWALLGTYLSWR